MQGGFCQISRLFLGNVQAVYDLLWNAYAEHLTTECDGLTGDVSSALTIAHCHEERPLTWGSTFCWIACMVAIEDGEKNNIIRHNGRACIDSFEVALACE